MKADATLAMIRQVCASFEGESFSLVDAARRMVRLHPVAPSQVFTEGWEALLLIKELIPDSVMPGKYRLVNPEAACPAVRVTRPCDARKHT